MRPKWRGRSRFSAVTDVGRYPEEIFYGYYDVQEHVGVDEMKNIPYGAIAMWTLADKLSAGLQQLMAGARKFSLAEISRDDIVSGNRETERETGIPFTTISRSLPGSPFLT